MASLRVEENFYQLLEKEINILKLYTQNIYYESVSLYGLIKMPFYYISRNIYLNKSKQLIKIREFLWVIHKIIQLVVYKKQTIGELKLGDEDGSYIFVIDHDQQIFMEMQLDVIKLFHSQNIIIVTSNEAIYNKMFSNFLSIYDVKNFMEISPLSWRHFRQITEIIWRSFFFKSKSLLTRAYCTLFLMRSLKQIDFYHKFLHKDRISGVVTLNDVQSHENAITQVARLKGIPTYTLQHGLIDVLHTPVYSDKIFVWGEVARQELIGLGVPDEKIVLSGRPGLDKTVHLYSDRADAVKKSYFDKYCRGESKPIVTYVAGNYGPDEEELLLKCFLSVYDLDVLPIIKLKPTINDDQRMHYKSWVKNYTQNRNICMLLDEDIYDIIAASDIVVGFQSSVLVEAMAFSTVCIVLDIFEEIDLKTILPHYDDCLVVTSGEELKRQVARIANDMGQLATLQGVSRSNSHKYFKDSLNNNSSEFIFNYITSLVR